MTNVFVINIPFLYSWRVDAGFIVLLSNFSMNMFLPRKSSLNRRMRLINFLLFRALESFVLLTHAYKQIGKLKFTSE